LLFVVVLLAFLIKVTDAIVIFVIVLFATTLGSIQEYGAEQALATLKVMAASISLFQYKESILIEK